MLLDEPAVAVPGAVTKKCVAASRLTVIVPELPVMEDVTVSVAVTPLAPTVFRVTENVPVPLVSVVLEGSKAAPSELVNCTVPG